jgi:hypothetical protein
MGPISFSVIIGISAGLSMTQAKKPACAIAGIRDKNYHYLSSS